MQSQKVTRQNRFTFKREIVFGANLLGFQSSNKCERLLNFVLKISGDFQPYQKNHFVMFCLAAGPNPFNRYWQYRTSGFIGTIVLGKQNATQVKQYLAGVNAHLSTSDCTQVVGVFDGSILDFHSLELYGTVTNRTRGCYNSSELE